MSAQSTPIGMDLSEAATERNDMVSQSMSRLQHLAFRALTVRGIPNNEFVALCIMVDSRWRELADILMPNVPGAYWQAYRDRGALPVLVGTASNGACAYVLKTLPN